MIVLRHRAFRILAAVFCVIGVMAGAEEGTTMWTLVVFLGCSSAVMLPVLINSASPARIHMRPEASR